MKRTLIALTATLLLACGTPSDSAETAGQTPDAAAATPAATPPTQPAPPPPKTALDPNQFKTVHEYTQMFYDGKIDLLHERFTADMSAGFPLEQLTAMHKQVGELYGKEVSVLGEETQTKDDYRAFVRWARFDKTEEIMEIQWILNPQDEIAGFFVRPAQRKVDVSGPGSTQ